MLPAKEDTVNTGALAICEKDQRDVLDLYTKLRQSEARLIGPDGKVEILPNNINSFLYRLLAELKAGHSMTFLQPNAQLTTVDASKMLGMSRQFLIQLLKKNEIPYHMVGTHRRLYARDVLAYKAKRDAARRSALDDLARAEFEEGHYKSVPSNDSDTSK